MAQEPTLSQLRRIARALIEPNDVPECEEFRTLLAAYVEAELDQRRADDEFPTVARHLVECDACRQELAELRVLLQAERAGELLTPSQPLAIDYGYLQQIRVAPDSAALWSALTHAGEQIRRLSSTIRLQLGEAAASFAQVPQQLMPRPLATAALRQGEPGAGPGAQLLPIPAPDPAVTLGLILGPVADQQTTLGVQVSTGREQTPVERARVLVRDESRRMLASELTDSRGQAFFAHIGPGMYIVQVRYQAQLWEIPVHFVGDPPDPVGDH